MLFQPVFPPQEKWILWKTEASIFFLQKGLLDWYLLKPHGCMVRGKCSVIFVSTATVTDHGSLSPVCLVAIWKWHCHKKNRRIRDSTIFQWNTCPIHDTLSKQWRSAGGKHRIGICRTDHFCKGCKFFSNLVYVEGFVNSPWAGVILMAGSKGPAQAGKIMQTADSASAKICGLLNAQNSQSRQWFQEQHLASCCQLQ